MLIGSILLLVLVLALLVRVTWRRQQALNDR
jgi:hypothetical protein